MEQLKADPLSGHLFVFGLGPFEYLKDLFTRLPAAKITEIREFTPTAWAKAKEKEKDFAQAS